MAHGGQELRLDPRQLLQVLVALGEVGQQDRLVDLGFDRGVPVLVPLPDHTVDKDAERDEQQRLEDCCSRIAGGRVDEADQDQVGHGERRPDGELDRGVVEREEDQRQEDEWEGAHDAEPELDLQGEGDRQPADGRDRVEVPRDALPGQDHQRAA